MSLTLLKDQFGILLINLGTPEQPTAKGVKKYLRQFLSDPRVVDINPLIWYPILYGVVLPFRAPKVAKLYAKIWSDQGSPLLAWSRKQQAALAERFPEMPVEFAMTYGKPSIYDGLAKLRQQDIHTIVVLPLYPQYSSTTTASAWDELIKANIKIIKDDCNNKLPLPEIFFVRDYADHNHYIMALVNSIRRSFSQHGQPERLVFSYHGIPQRYADEGDEYPLRCELTTQLVVEQLGLTKDQYIMTYQSRFGREPWLQPYTDRTLQDLALQGIKHIQIICPGFSCDCLETIIEIDEENRHLFLASGGEQFYYIPALNDHADHLDLIQELVNERIRPVN